MSIPYFADNDYLYKVTSSIASTKLAGSYLIIIAASFDLFLFARSFFLFFPFSFCDLDFFLILDFSRFLHNHVSSHLSRLSTNRRQKERHSASLGYTKKVLPLPSQSHHKSKSEGIKHISKQIINHGNQGSSNDTHSKRTPITNLHSTQPLRSSREMDHWNLWPRRRNGAHWRNHPPHQIRSIHDRLETPRLPSSHLRTRLARSIRQVQTIS